MKRNFLFLVVLATAACAADSEGAHTPATVSAPATPPSTVPSTRPESSPSTRPASLPRLVVHKSPSCGCCALWVDHMREAGFEVEVDNSDNLNPIKERLGVPYGHGSCHTAEVGGYFIEGHVPAQDVKRLLAEKPPLKGLAVPGMPMGSPGMEVPSGEVQPYVVLAVDHNGATQPYAEHH